MFIVIDWIDWAGKSTQLELLRNYLEKQWKKVKVISYPQYGQWSCFYVEKYLNWGYWKNVSAKQASIFYALDRFDSKESLEKDLKEYDYILSDRYVSANMIHQWGKIWDSKKREEFLKWVYDLEYNILALPKPDLTVFLNISVESSQKLIDTREDKDYITSDSQKDIHEGDLEHLESAKSVVSQVVSMQENFESINCEEDWKMLSREKVLERIISKIG